MALMMAVAEGWCGGATTASQRAAFVALRPASGGVGGVGGLGGAWAGLPGMAGSRAEVPKPIGSMGVSGPAGSRPAAGFGFHQLYWLVVGAVVAAGAVGLVTVVWTYTLRRSVRARTTELAAANAARGRFLATMSHEVRTPMNAVLGLIQILERESLTPVQKDVVRRLATTGRSLLCILNDILDFSRIEAGGGQIERAPFELEPLLVHLDELFGEAARGRGLAWRVEGPDALAGRLVGDPLRLEQVLSNLVANAIKFTQHGEVNLRAIPLHVTDDAVTMRFEVRDSGIGIAPEGLTRLFQPFTQANPSIVHQFGGTGLGLSICRRLVALMGGSLGADSSVGSGSTFWVEIPFTRTAAADAAPASVDGAAKLPRPRLAGCQILVVDDNWLNLELSEWALKQEGASVVLVTDALQALMKLQEEPRRFQAVLMDVRMPGMDGLDAMRAIRQASELGRIPLIAYTAGVLPEQRQEAFAAGANDFIAKPVDLEELVRVLERWTRDRVAEPLPPSPASSSASIPAPDGPVPAEAAPARSGTPVPAPANTSPTMTVAVAVTRVSAFPEVLGIDTAHAAGRLRNNRELFLRLIREFRAEFGGLVPRLREDLAGGRTTEAARRLHTLRGITGNLGALELGQAASTLEQAIRGSAPAGELAGRLETFAVMLTSLNDAIGRV